MSTPRPESLPPLTDSQTEFLEVIWDRGEVSVTEVRETLKGRRDIARNTVQTILARLAEKGWLRFRSIGNTFFYSATISRKKTQKFFAKRMVDSLFKGSTEGLVMSLLENQPVSEAEAARIRKMLDRSEGQITPNGRE